MSTRKLLLADDSVTIQKVVNLTFADEGIEVITVGDGDSAMEKMAEIAPDLVLADVNMPGLNGYEVCERIKNSAEFQRVPVVLLVGSFEPFDEEEARRVGADDFLTKPFQSIRQLVSKVTILLDNNSVDESPNRDSFAAGSFADTLDMDKPETAATTEHQFNDDGMDDGLIQTTPASNFALDESAKFETKAIEEPNEDAGKTQPLSVYDLKDFDFVAADSLAAAEDQTVSDKEENHPAEHFSDSELATENASLAQESKSLPYQDSDDDFLELPFDEDEDEEDWEDENQQSAPTENRQEESEESSTENRQEEITASAPLQESGQNAEYAEASAESKEFESAPEDYREANEIVVGSLTEPAPEELKTEIAAESAVPETAAPEFSSELIDAIAERVIAKLSDKIVREIAWEVVPQHADLIIKKMVEEKLREQ